MTASYNSTDRRAELIGDGTGWQRMKTIALDAPPAGTNQVIYVIRGWMDDLAGNYNETVAHAASCYFGFSFTGNHIDTSDSSNAEYQNFFGPALTDDSSPFNLVEVDEYVFGGKNNMLGGVSSTNASIQSGYSTPINTDMFQSIGNSAFMLPSPQSRGIEFTSIWRIYTSLVDDSVNYQVWVNDDSLNLDTFNFSTINQDNPELQIPAISSSYKRSGTIHGDITGTNWRPSTGVMAFPTHFIARWGGTNFGMYFSHVVPVYGKLTV